MDVRTFEAFSMRDAIKAVKSELGQDAVILSTRQIPAPGRKGSMVEITAASSATARQNGASTGAAISTGDSTQILSAIGKLREEMVTKSQLNSLETAFAEIRALVSEAVADRNGSLVKGLPRTYGQIDKNMQIMGVADPYRAKFIAFARNYFESKPDSLNDESIRNLAIKWMMKNTQIAPAWETTPGTCSIHLICGSTGVGKTSMTSRIAAHFKLKQHKSVVLVSFDNEKLAATEQLRIYGKIANIEFKPVSEATEIVSMANRTDPPDLIIVDTAGQCPKTGVNTEEFKFIKQQTQNTHLHLLLSVTEKEDQMNRAIQAFAPAGIDSLMFSKLDQSWTFGEMFNMQKKWTLPLSYFSTGKQIPDDLERATRERIVERIFGAQ